MLTADPAGAANLLTWHQFAAIGNDDYLVIMETPASTYSLYYSPKGTMYERHSWAFIATYPSQLAAMVGAEIWELLTRGMS